MKYLHDPVKTKDRENGFSPVPGQFAVHIILHVVGAAVLHAAACALETYTPCVSCTCIDHCECYIDLSCWDYADCCLGVSPVHFGAILVLNLIIGLSTPPVGVCLFIACRIANVSLEQISKTAVPFLLVCVVVLLIITYFPELVMYLPNLWEQ